MEWWCISNTTHTVVERMMVWWPPQFIQNLGLVARWVDVELGTARQGVCSVGDGEEPRARGQYRQTSLNTLLLVRV